MVFYVERKGFFIEGMRNCVIIIDVCKNFFILLLVGLFIYNVRYIFVLMIFKNRILMRFWSDFNGWFLKIICKYI